MLSFSSASRTSSTLCGRTMLLISFIPLLHPSPAQAAVLPPGAAQSNTGKLADRRCTASIADLQHTFDLARERFLLGVAQLACGARDVQYVDGPFSFRRDQGQMQIAALGREHAGDTVQQARRVVGHDLEHRKLARVLVVEVDDRRAAHATATQGTTPPASA